jgi:hypothetical protein
MRCLRSFGSALLDMSIFVLYNRTHILLNGMKCPGRTLDTCVRRRRVAEYMDDERRDPEPPKWPF